MKAGNYSLVCHWLDREGSEELGTVVDVETRLLRRDKAGLRDFFTAFVFSRGRGK